MQHKRHILLGWTAAVFIGLLWGAPWIAGIPLLKSMNSIVLVWLRYIVSVITLFTLLRIGYKKVEIRDYGVNRLIDNKKDFLWTVICGVVGQGAFSFFSFLSLKWISAAENGIIQGLIPMVILIIGSVFFNSRFKLIQIFAVIGAFVGVAILTLNPSDKITGSSIGYLFCFISVLSFASTAHARAKLAKKYGSVTTMFQQDLSAAIFFTLILALTGQDFSSALTAFYSPVNIFCILVLGAGVSGISYIIYIYAMKNVGVEGCNMALNLMPVSSFFLAIYFLREEVTIYKIAALIIVLLALVVFVKKS